MGMPGIDLNCRGDITRRQSMNVFKPLRNNKRRHKLSYRRRRKHHQHGVC